MMTVMAMHTCRGDYCDGDDAGDHVFRRRGNDDDADCVNMAAADADVAEGDEMQNTVMMMVIMMIMMKRGCQQEGQSAIA